MTADGGMRRMAEQNNELRMQMRALDAGPKARRRKFVLWEAVCQGCGDVLVEVLALHPYRVLHFRGLQHPDPRDSTQHPAVGLRSGGWEFIPLSASEPDESAATLVNCACRCQTVQLSMHHIYRHLATDTHKSVIPAPR